MAMAMTNHENVEGDGAPSVMNGMAGRENDANAKKNAAMLCDPWQGLYLFYHGRTVIGFTR